MKKYGKYFWAITLVPTIWSWYELLTIGFNYSYIIDTICFTGFSIYFYLKGTNRFSN